MSDDICRRCNGGVGKVKGERKRGSKAVFDEAEEDGLEVNAEIRNLFIEKQQTNKHQLRRPQKSSIFYETLARLMSRDVSRKSLTHCERGRWVVGILNNFLN